MDVLDGSVVEAEDVVALDVDSVVEGPNEDVDNVVEDDGAKDIDADVVELEVDVEAVDDTRLVDPLDDAIEVVVTAVVARLVDVTGVLEDDGVSEAVVATSVVPIVDVDGTVELVIVVLAPLVESAVEVTKMVLLEPNDVVAAPVEVDAAVVVVSTGVVEETLVDADVTVDVVASAVVVEALVDVDGTLVVSMVVVATVVDTLVVTGVVDVVVVVVVVGKAESSRSAVFVTIREPE